MKAHSWNKLICGKKSIDLDQFLFTSNPKGPLLGESCAGSVIYIIKIIDHSNTFTQKIGESKSYTEFKKEENIELIKYGSWKVVHYSSFIQHNNATFTVLYTGLKKLEII